MARINIENRENAWHVEIFSFKDVIVQYEV